MTQTAITMRVSLNGTVTGNIDGLEFGARVEREPSIDGIYEGRVCKLSMAKVPDVLLMYDRGWYVPVPELYRGLYEKVVKALEGLPA